MTEKAYKIYTIDSDGIHEFGYYRSLGQAQIEEQKLREQYNVDFEIEEIEINL